jgi:hypothetical protein
MPVSYEPKVLLAYFLVTIVSGAGWSLGCWVVGRLLR